MYEGRQRAVILAVLAVAVAVIAFLLLRGDDNGGGPVEPTVASGEDLRELAEDAGHEVYWAGERPNTRIEFEEADDGLVYVRYLPETGDPAADRDRSLTIGSYPVGDAIAGLEVVAGRKGTTRQELPGGALVVTNENRPTSVYLAYPGSPIQIEVYDPDSAKAMQVAVSGDVIPLR